MGPYTYKSGLAQNARRARGLKTLTVRLYRHSAAKPSGSAILYEGGNVRLSPFASCTDGNTQAKGCTFEQRWPDVLFHNVYLFKNILVLSEQNLDSVRWTQPSSYVLG
jgi:hypothetical protein